jgi:hypothetical protein
MFALIFKWVANDLHYMGPTAEGEPPLIQRFYDRIWLLATLAVVFWFVTYVVWGLVDIFTVPMG